MIETNSTAPWHCGAHRLELGAPLIMGILNVTPDSFSDGGTHERPEEAVEAGLVLSAQGAMILDVGGESTRPGSGGLPPSEELARVLPVVSRLAATGLVVSVDTRQAEVAAEGVAAGAAIINDVSGFRDPAMVDVAAGCDAGVVIMHMLGEPGTMQFDPHYDDVTGEVIGYLLDQANMLQAAGVACERIALDPGIGFGKTLQHNVALIAAVAALASHGYPVLVGASRKRFIGELTGESEPRERLGGSVAAAVESARRGGAILRVHDVAATAQALAVSRALWAADKIVDL